IAAAGLLLLGRVGPARRGPERNRKRRCQHQAELELPAESQHESPQAVRFRIVGEWRGNGKEEGYGTNNCARDACALVPLSELRPRGSVPIAKCRLEFWRHMSYFLRQLTEVIMIQRRQVLAPRQQPRSPIESA